MQTLWPIFVWALLLTHILGIVAEDPAVPSGEENEEEEEENGVNGNNATDLAVASLLATGNNGSAISNNSAPSTGNNGTTNSTPPTTVSPTVTSTNHPTNVPSTVTSTIPPTTVPSTPSSTLPSTTTTPPPTTHPSTVPSSLNTVSAPSTVSSSAPSVTNSSSANPNDPATNSITPSPPSLDQSTTTTPFSNQNDTSWGMDWMNPVRAKNNNATNATNPENREPNPGSQNSGSQNPGSQNSESSSVNKNASNPETQKGDIRKPYGGIRYDPIADRYEIPCDDSYRQQQGDPTGYGYRNPNLPSPFKHYGRAGYGTGGAWPSYNTGSQYPAKADSLGGYGYSSYGYDTDDAYGGAQTARSGPYGDTRLPKPASGLPGYGGYRNPSTMSPNPLTPKQHRSTDGIQHRGYGPSYLSSLSVADNYGMGESGGYGSASRHRLPYSMPSYGGYGTQSRQPYGGYGSQSTGRQHMGYQGPSF